MTYKVSVTYGPFRICDLAKTVGWDSIRKLATLQTDAVTELQRRIDWCGRLDTVFVPKGLLIQARDETERLRSELSERGYECDCGSRD